MTNKGAIETLQANVIFACEKAGLSNAAIRMTEDALDMAIAALEKEVWKEEHLVSPLLDLQPCKQDDLISRAAAQPETHEKRTETHACDYIERQAAIDAVKEHRALFCDNTPDTFSKLSYAEKSRIDELDMAIATLINLPSAQPEQKTCEGCMWEDAYGYGSCPNCSRAYREDLYLPMT